MGVEHFPGGGGVQLFTGESNFLFSQYKLITCDFPEGGPDRPPPLRSGSAHVIPDTQSAIFLFLKENVCSGYSLEVVLSSLNDSFIPLAD